MGLISTALQIGRSSLLAYQSALQLVGQNVANAANPDYVRRSPQLRALPGPLTPDGFRAGNGVALAGLRRNISEALEQRVRTAVADHEAADTERQRLAEIENILDALSDTDLGSLLTEFFGTFRELQTDPQNLATRGLLITQAENVARRIQQMRTDFLRMQDEINTQVDLLVRQANDLLEQVRALNVEIVAAQARGPGQSEGLRDERDALLREISEIVAIRVREDDTGAVNVYLGNDPVVLAGTRRELVVETETPEQGTGGSTSGVVQRVVRFADTLGDVTLEGGQLEGLVQARDVRLVEQRQALDSLATALIHQVNRVHASGQGLVGYTSVTGTYAVSDPDLALNDADIGLDLVPVNGTLLITVTNDSTGETTTRQIHIDLDGIGTDTTLNSLAADINAAFGNLTATVTPDNRLQLVTATGFSVTFAEDTSDVLAALGINTFFDGADSSDIAVNATLAGDPRLVAAATQRLPGDGSNAARLADAGSEHLTELGGVGILDFYRNHVTSTAVASSAARAGTEAAETLLSALTAQRESISGVNLDEEAVQMVKFERAFQGSARYLAVVDEMIATMLSLVR